ncbi:protein SAD1/UNC-84 domain-containing protein [Cinnamomum micranthum f. kanehirae]|uniref:Protein SAD1/UNC-84 domain-containing protein n=1 Tax=Cinnamomum micranthum f. kanehirae TaxID=337451 RepID=A0A443NBI3_9MAGN|nr:protein SAD1/UNC-84 domain-containing protein [Cinnamomum micranthum f. kanehirae]
MSAPTVAVGTNSAVMNGPSLVLDPNSKLNNRRRVVTSMEKRISVETFTKEGYSDPRCGERVGTGKDVGHLIRGGAGSAERFDEFPLSPRKRKGIPKPGKPRWKRVISVLTKNLILLLVLFWLGQKIRHWVAKYQDGVVSSDRVLGFEGRISEVEALLKSTAKMMQAKVDVVDKRIESEVGSLRREVTERVEEKSVLVESQLKELGDRTESLEKALADLRVASFLTKEEFEIFENELKASQEQKGGEEELNLDKIKALAKEIVEKEIEKHAADGLGRVDYALALGGGRVVRHSEPFLLEKASSWLTVGKIKIGVHYTAHKMLEPSFGEPGQCFALKGSAGFVVIRLRTAIIPEAVTLEHVAKSVAYDRSSAPKDCQVSGWFQGHDEDPFVQVDKTFMLAEFAYDLEKSNAQTFNIDASDAGLINMVRFDFTSNQGNLQHTCIYRLRVHGHESDSLATSAV